MMRSEELANALDVVLRAKADRMLQNEDYVAHVRRCNEVLEITDPLEAFIFGGLDAMMQDFGSAAQMIRPPGSKLDVSVRKHRLDRLQRWRLNRLNEGKLPLSQVRQAHGGGVAYYG